MNRIQLGLDRLEENPIYARVAPVLAVLALVIAITAIGWTWSTDRATTAENTRLLGCFDDFADDLTGSLPPVRDASARRDVALGDVLEGIQNLLSKAVSGGENGPEAAAELLDDLEAYRTANEALEQARRDNPYPDPPSEFCGPPPS